MNYQNDRNLNCMNMYNQYISTNENMKYNTRNPNNIANFNDGFRQSNQIIEKVNNSNPGYVIHNNLHDNLLAEHIVEYHINIDSDDRKIEAYPNPFDYVVTFKSLGKTTYKPFKKLSTRSKLYDETEVEIPETPAPVISRTFKNVKYVKLDHVILSRYYLNRYTMEQHITIDTVNNQIQIKNVHLNKHCHKTNKKNGCYLCISKEDCNSFCNCDCDQCNRFIKCQKCFKNKKKHLIDKCNCKLDDNCHSCGEICCKCSIIDKNKFLILKVKELKNNRIFSTNIATSDNTFVLHVDKSLGNCHNVWITRFGTCTFPNSLLYNLERLSIEFCNNKGEKLKFGIIFQYNLRINNIHHKICLIFGKIDEEIKSNINDSTIMEFPINELNNKKSWHRRMFNDILSHIDDCNIKKILNENYEKMYNSIEKIDIDDLIKYDITNNVFFILGVVQNELNTLTKYEY